MFNLDNGTAGLAQRGMNMAPRRLKTGQGFSLFDLQDVLANITDTLVTALNKQGVDVNKDSTFLRLQGLVQDLNSSSAYDYNQAMVASDKIPYSVAGDMVVIAYEHFRNGDKTEAVKNILAAMNSDDFGAIANGLLLMNKKSENNLLADDSDDTEDSDTDDTDDTDEDLDEDDSDDTDDSDVEDDDDLDDNDIEKLINDHETVANDDTDEDDSDTDNSDNTDATEDKVEDTKEKPKDTKEVKNEVKNVPMGKTSSTITASHTAKVLANRMSLDGGAINRSKARDFLKKNPTL